MRPPALRLWLVPLALPLATGWGCVSLRRTPEARFFVLRALAQPPRPAGPPLEAVAAGPAAAGRVEATALVGLLPVRIPEHLARPQLVRWAGPNELRIDEFLRWSEPLDAAATRTIAENLDSLLPQVRVVRAPWRAAAALRCRVATEIGLFGVQTDGSVRLEGSFVLLARDEERPLGRRAFSFSRQPLAPAVRAADPGASVEQMSSLLVDLAQEIAVAYTALPPGPEPGSRP